MESLICSFYLSVAARKIVCRSVPEIHSHVAGTLSNQPTNKQTILQPPLCFVSLFGWLFLLVFCLFFFFCSFFLCFSVFVAEKDNRFHTRCRPMFLCGFIIYITILEFCQLISLPPRFPSKYEQWFIDEWHSGSVSFLF